MKPISIHVPDGAYLELKSLAARRQRPVAELMRQAMLDYLEQARRSDRSLVDVPAHRSGALLASWTRSEIADEMLS